MRGFFFFFLLQQYTCRENIRTLHLCFFYYSLPVICNFLLFQTGVMFSRMFLPLQKAQYIFPLSFFSSNSLIIFSLLFSSFIFFFFIVDCYYFFFKRKKKKKEAFLTLGINSIYKIAHNLITELA